MFIREYASKQDLLEIMEQKVNLLKRLLNSIPLTLLFSKICIIIMASTTFVKFEIALCLNADAIKLYYFEYHLLRDHLGLFSKNKFCWKARMTDDF